MKTCKHLYEKIVSWENLLAAYKTFRKGKRFKDDVLKFEYNYETELFKLRDELMEHTYFPLPAHRFFVYEPKKREIGVNSIFLIMGSATIYDILWHLLTKLNFVRLLF